MSDHIDDTGKKVNKNDIIKKLKAENEGLYGIIESQKQTFDALVKMFKEPDDHNSDEDTE